MPSSLSPAPAVTPQRVPLDGDATAADAALLVRGDDRPFALTGRWFGARAVAGSAPVRVAGPDEDPIALLGDVDAARNSIDAPEGFVGGGWVGYLGFALGGQVDAVPPPATVRERLPAAALAFHDHLLRLDDDGQWWFEALWTEARADALAERLAVLRARLTGMPAAVAFTTAPWRAEPSPAGHARAVAACRERIAGGDLYQANLSLRLRSRLTGDPADLYARGVAALHPERAAYLAGPWGALASLSPELFLTRHGELVTSAPIKGTRPRAADPAEAAASRVELLASEKDRAENTMIVDLVRNDLGRVSVPGSVRVTALADVRPHPGVWHLVSEIEGRLVPGTTDADLLRATFPPGSVTGAPKLAAIAVIAELESAARQVFTGAIGLSSPVAGLELNVAIRTFEVCGDDVWLDVGGGIVADSDPSAEAAEALVKARPLLAAIGAGDALDLLAADGAADVPAAVPRPLRLGPKPLPRPDPAAGVFETMLVEGGTVAALDAHISRLAVSLAAVYGSTPTADLVDRARAAAAAAAGPCRLRLLAAPDGSVTIEPAPLPVPGPLTLEPVTVPGGLGPHKWRDRRLLDAVTGATAPAVPLLVDLDGSVLEAAWANVLVVVADGTLVTPPLDGRILPGVARAAVLDRARSLGLPVVERRLGLRELATAREVLLTSALRGAVPVGPPGPVGVALSR